MREAAARWMVALSSSLFAFAMAEGVLRLWEGPPVHFRFPQEAYATDPELGYALLPSQRAFTHDQEVRVNAGGLRGPEAGREPSRGTRRVLALGDSQTFGNGLSEDDTWPLRLQAVLARDGARWEVLNAGLPGTSTWQQERLLARLGERYRFHLVVVGLYQNDIVATPESAASHDPSALSNSARHRLLYLLKRSAFFTALWQARSVLDPGSGGMDYETAIVRGEAGDAGERAWAHVEAALVRMQRLARKEGAELIVLLIPRRDQVDGRLTSDAWNQRATAIAARHGIPSVDGLPVLRDAHERHGDRLFIPWDGHNTRRANEALADALAPTAQRVAAATPSLARTPPPR